MAGWRPDDVITEQDILDIVWRQKELNFAPGEEHLYSNSGYTLLGVIVKRVSGKSLRESRMSACSSLSACSTRTSTTTTVSS